MLNFFSIPLFILGGIFLQPLFREIPTVITLLSQFGLLVLLFCIGFEISPLRYLRNIRKVIYDGSVDLLVTFVLPIVIIYAISMDIEFTLFLAALLYVSSSAINLKIIVESKFTIYSFAEKVINIALFQDLLITALILILPILFIEFKNESVLIPIFNILIFPIFLAIIYFVMKNTKNLINKSTEEAITLFSFAIMVFSSFISHKLINSEAIGAFMIGSILKTINYRVDIKKAFEPIKDIFSPFFFFHFGLNINTGFAMEHWFFIFTITIISIASKYFASYILYPQKLSNMFRNLLFGLLTIRGEFSIVLAAISYNYLDEKSFSLISITSTFIIFVNVFLGLIFVRIYEKKLKLSNS
ncbi:MAG: cation:proton antiporter [Deltaproteobacteria bacterium]|nr:cation:proton antiporter [Deltaproteobacteria bacterium]